MSIPDQPAIGTLLPHAFTLCFCFVCFKALWHIESHMHTLWVQVSSIYRYDGHRMEDHCMVLESPMGGEVA
jgi:hypothetical protein